MPEGTSKNLAALGAAVRELRTERGLSQETLADAAGLHRTYVGGIERGERNIGFENLIRLAGALQVDAVELMRRFQSAQGADSRGRRRR